MLSSFPKYLISLVSDLCGTFYGGRISGDNHWVSHPTNNWPGENRLIGQSARILRQCERKPGLKKDQCWLSAPHHNRYYWRAAQLSPNQHPVKYEPCQRWQRLKNDPTQLQITLKMSDGVDSTESISVLSFWFELIWFKQKINEIINTADRRKGWWLTIAMQCIGEAEWSFYETQVSLGSGLWVSMAERTRACSLLLSMMIPTQCQYYCWCQYESIPGNS